LAKFIEVHEYRSFLYGKGGYVMTPSRLVGFTFIFISSIQSFSCRAGCKICYILQIHDNIHPRSNRVYKSDLMQTAQVVKTMHIS
jgi:hypothetical protein